jgi:hypothetical protein
MTRHVERGTDIVVSSWSELMDALSGEPLVRQSGDTGYRARSHFLFRGVSNADWPLRSSLERMESPSSVEQPLLRSFQKYIPPSTTQGSTQWELLAVARHNGLPTRCLDWTFSPLVAAHFATVNTRHHAEDGAIWCVDAVRWRDELLPAELKQDLERELSWVYDVRTLARSFEDLRAFDAAFAEREQVLLFLEPPSLDGRIANQGGILSLLSTGPDGHDAYLRGVMRERPGIVRRLRIAARAKAQIRDMLDQNNINERLLIPGLPGLCEWLKRYYSPARPPAHDD